MRNVDKKDGEIFMEKDFYAFDSLPENPLFKLPRDKFLMNTIFFVQTKAEKKISFSVRNSN